MSLFLYSYLIAVGYKDKMLKAKTPQAFAGQMGFLGTEA
jgi:hypothetical protein